MEEKNSKKINDDFKILIKEHPELGSKILDYINGDEFDTLYNQYFKSPLINCMNACINQMGTTYIYVVNDEILKNLGYHNYKSYAEAMVVHDLVSETRQRCILEGTDLFTALNDLFSNNLLRSQLNKYVISILSQYSKSIGMGYVNMLLEYLAQESNQYDDYDNEIEPS